MSPSNRPPPSPPKKPELSPAEKDFQKWMEDFEFGDEEDAPPKPPAVKKAPPSPKPKKR